MKFELFGRLKDNDNGGSSSNKDFNSDFGSGQDQMDMGSGLDRTVESMFDQGYSEDEIKQELAGQYNESDIDEAITNAVASSAQGRGGSKQGGPEPMTPYKQGEDQAVSPMDKGFNNNQSQQDSMNEPNNQGAPQNSPEPIQQEPQQNQPQRNVNADPQTEELIETIIAENVDDIFNEFEAVYSEIDELKNQVEDMDQRLHDLEVRDDEDQQQFVSKVEEMEDHVDNYQARIGGLEKAFQQVLPSLVDNVQDLTGLVQEIKDEKGIETESDVDADKIKNMDMEDW